MSHHNFCKNKLLSKGERCVGFNNVELKELISNYYQRCQNIRE